MSNWLVAERLSKSFGGIQAVDNVDLALPPSGRITTIIGPNGAGKTTLLNLLSGALRPDRGSIRVGGKDIMDMGLLDRVQIGIGRTFQHTGVFSGLTPREHLRLVWPSRKPESEIIDFLDSFSLVPLADTPAKELNHVSQRLLEVAMVLATEPRLLMLDEPTAGMDIGETSQIAEVVTNARDAMAVLIVEHDMDFVLRISDRIIVMDYGKVIASGTPREVQQNERVREAYIGGVGIK